MRRRRTTTTTRRRTTSLAPPSPRCPSRRPRARQQAARRLLLLLLLWPLSPALPPRAMEGPSSRRRRRDLGLFFVCFEVEIFQRRQRFFFLGPFLFFFSPAVFSLLLRLLPLSLVFDFSPSAPRSEASVSVEASTAAGLLSPGFLLLPQRSQMAGVDVVDVDDDDECRRRRRCCRRSIRRPPAAGIRRSTRVAPPGRLEKRAEERIATAFH